MLSFYIFTLAASEALERLAANELVAPIDQAADQAADAIDLGEVDENIFRRFSAGRKPSTCDTDRDCGHGYQCSNCCGFCVRVNGGWEGDTCAHYTHCAGRLRCLQHNGFAGTQWNFGTCQKRRNGDSCRWDSECKSDFCANDGSCRQPKRNNGESCEWDSECKSGFCEEHQVFIGGRRLTPLPPKDGTCQTPKKSNGQSCQWDSQCKSNFCEFDRATAFAVRPDEGTLKKSGGRRPESGTCQQPKKSNGEMCHWDSECKSGFCELDEATAFSLGLDADEGFGGRRLSVVHTGTCQKPKKANGEWCKWDSQCQSGYCLKKKRWSKYGKCERDEATAFSIGPDEGF